MESSVCHAERSGRRSLKRSRSISQGTLVHDGEPSREIPRLRSERKLSDGGCDAYRMDRHRQDGDAPWWRTSSARGSTSTVQNRSQGKVHELAAMGATVGESFASMGAELDEVHTCLPDTETVQAVLTGAGGVLERPKQGLIVVDHSTIHPDAARTLAAAARERGASFIDAPVSGSGPRRRARRVDHHVRRRCGRVRCGAACDGSDGAHRRVDGRVRLRRGHQGGEQLPHGDEPRRSDGVAAARGQGGGWTWSGSSPSIRTASGASRAWERNVPRILNREFGKGRLRLAHDEGPRPRARNWRSSSGWTSRYSRRAAASGTPSLRSTAWARRTPRTASPRSNSASALRWVGRTYNRRDAMTDYTTHHFEAASHYTVSVGYDRRLYEHDIAGSVAHARMLGRQGIISEADAVAIVEGLDAVRREIADGAFNWREELEDLHMNIETRLHELIGEPAARLPHRALPQRPGRDRHPPLRPRFHRPRDRPAPCPAGHAAGAGRARAGRPPPRLHPPAACAARAVRPPHARLLRDVRPRRRPPRRCAETRQRPSRSAQVRSRAPRTPSTASRSRASSASTASPPTRWTPSPTADYAVEFLAAAATCMMHCSRLAEEIVLWDVAGVRLPAARAAVGHRLVHHAAEAQPGLRGDRARQDGPRLRPAWSACSPRSRACRSPTTATCRRTRRDCSTPSIRSKPRSTPCAAC